MASGLSAATNGTDQLHTGAQQLEGAIGQLSDGADQPYKSVDRVSAQRHRTQVFPLHLPSARRSLLVRLTPETPAGTRTKIEPCERL
ncbi:hypothetical protein ACQI5H_04385 [Mycobacterium heidelbergense]|uniref:hypothetical protein n=1 Tax=Mycobacterium heidelbergense TaxID=53376 RepID=UPI003CF4F951